MAVLAVDIGGTNIRTALFTTPRHASPVTTKRCRDLGKPVPVEAFAHHVERELFKWAHSGQRADAIGIAAAAVVDHRTGYIKVGENVGWQDVPLKDLLEARWHLPVQVDVDAFCGALAEARLGAGQPHAHFLYVVLGTGIGHGLVLDGKVWHGLHSAANVFGHLKVGTTGPACYCGQAACLCQYASGQGLARLAQDAAGEGLAPEAGRNVVEAWRRQESWATTIVDHAMDQLALALSHAYNLLDLEAAILGGGVVTEHFPDLDDLTRRVESLVYPQIRPVTIQRGRLGERAVLTGAALLAFDYLGDEPL